MPRPNRLHLASLCFGLALWAVADFAACAEPPAPDAALSKRIDDLIHRLGEGRFAEREKAQKELIEVGAPALAALRNATTSTDTEIARRAKACIPVIEVNVKVDALAEGLRHPKVEERLQAASGLAGLGRASARAFPPLLRALDDPDEQFRVRVVGALTVIGPDAAPAVPKLITILKDKKANEDLRFMAVRCLSTIGPAAEEAVPELLHMLKTEGAMFRNSAAYALGHIGGKDERVVPALLRLMDDPDQSVHANAARALAQIGKHPEKVVPALVEMIRKNPQPSKPDPELWRERASQRRAAVLALQQFGSAAAPAVPTLVEVAVDYREQPQTRQFAIQALGGIGPKAQAAVPALKSLPRPKDRPNGDTLAREAAQALQAIQRPEK